MKHTIDIITEAFKSQSTEELALSFVGFVLVSFTIVALVFAWLLL